MPIYSDLSPIMVNGAFSKVSEISGCKWAQLVEARVCPGGYDVLLWIAVKWPPFFTVAQAAFEIAQTFFQKKFAVTHWENTDRKQKDKGVYELQYDLCSSCIQAHLVFQVRNTKPCHHVQSQRNGTSLDDISKPAWVRFVTCPPPTRNALKPLILWGEIF